MAGPPPPGSTVPSVLAPELLGFVPQLLLDDIVDTANDAVSQAVDAMEQFLDRWADARKKANDDWDGTQEIEQGLVAFQTLLNSHTDIAFDFFETWALRNIFAIPPDLPLVAPHQAGLDLQKTAEEEAELLAEIKDLRRKIHAVRMYHNYRSGWRLHENIGRTLIDFSNENLKDCSQWLLENLPDSAHIPRIDLPSYNFSTLLRWRVY